MNPVHNLSEPVKRLVDYASWALGPDHDEQCRAGERGGAGFGLSVAKVKQARSVARVPGTAGAE